MKSEKKSMFCAVAGFQFSFEMNRMDYFWTVVGGGIFEESVFRGWFYNAWSAIVKVRIV